MNRLLTITVAGLLLAAEPPKAIQDLEGEWLVVEIEANGKKEPSYEVRSQRLVFAFRGNEITGSDEVFFTGSNKVTLDAARTPKTMDITWLDRAQKGQTLACIYSLEKDRLRFCF